MQVIGSLINNPILLADSKYIFTKNDFDLPLAKNIFMAISNLFEKTTMDKITIVDIDNYFHQFDGFYENFQKQNGLLLIITYFFHSRNVSPFADNERQRRHDKHCDTDAVTYSAGYEEEKRKSYGQCNYGENKRNNHHSAVAGFRNFFQ